MTVRVAINGFGRIGRNYLRAAKSQGADIDFVGVNDLTDNETLARLLRRDSAQGPYPGTVEASEHGLLVDGDELTVHAERDPADIDWGGEVDVVIESTGFFRDHASASKHIATGARKVIISAPAKDPDVTLVVGSNLDEYDPDNHHIISNASCTTNSVVPMSKVLDQSFGIDKGLMTTVHAYTGDQNLIDAPHSDPRRARAAALSIIPTTTGAARAAALVYEPVKGRLDGGALRVPVPTGSITDLTVVLNQDVTVEDVNGAMKAAAEGELAGILEYSEEPLVSIDIVGNPHSCIFDAGSTLAMGNLVKVMGWYDNEMGYSHRLVDLTTFIGSKL
jgi:glyceraldehyde 3-phosphate dehydrogenase